METFIHQVLAGLATGGIYASVALALVMIYQATHLLNFAQGEMAMFSTYIAWALIKAGVPYWAAFFLTVAFAFVLGVADRARRDAQPVRDALGAAVVIVFIGLLVIFNSVAGWIFTYTIKPFPSPFPKEPLFGQKYLSSHELGAIVVTLVVLTMLCAFFRFTPLGLAMRAAAQNPDLEPARRHPRRLDAGARLGPGRRDRRDRRHDGRADRLPRSEHDGRHPALRVRRAR